MLQRESLRLFLSVQIAGAGVLVYACEKSCENLQSRAARHRAVGLLNLWTCNGLGSNRNVTGYCLILFRAGRSQPSEVRPNS